MWRLQRLFPSQGILNIGFSLHPSDRIQLGPLRRALRWVVQRHLMLRSYVTLQGEQPVRAFRQAARESAHIEVRATTPAQLQADMRSLARDPFDLERDELIRFTVLEVATGEQVLLVVAHHLILDAMSIPTMAEDLAIAYESFRARRAQPVAREAATQEAGRPPSPEGLRYWRRRLDGLLPEEMHLHASDYSAAGSDFNGARHDRTLAPATSDAIHRLREYTRTTENVVLLAAYLLLLRRYGAEANLSVGIHVNLRRPFRKPIVGHYTSVLPLLVQVENTASFVTLVRRTLLSSMEALRYRDISYESVVHHLRRDHYDWQAPLFRHTFNYVPALSDFTVRGWAGSLNQIDTGYSRFDLEFAVTPSGHEHELHVAYRTALHDSRFVHRLCDRYESLLLSAAADPEQSIGRLPMTTAHDDVIRLTNQTDVRWGGQESVAAMIDHQIRATPGAVALVTASGTCTYSDLDRLAEGVTERLRSAGVGKGAVVGLEATRMPVTAAAVLAVWRAGAAYLPLDPNHPRERLEFQLNDASAVTVVSGAAMAEKLRDWRGTFISVDGELSAISENPAARSIQAPDPGSPAYIIYTSGSTGRPKGVSITHANLINTINYFGQLLRFHRTMSMMWLTTFIFDISALELFLPLTRGGRVIVADEGAAGRPELLMRLIKDFNTDVIQATPTTWRMIAGLGLSDLAGRRILCGGEPLTAALAEQLRASGGHLINVYGPTEATIWSTAEQVHQVAAGQQPSVGQPIANTTIGVIDEFGADCPVDIVGEVVIGGAGVAAGYVNDDDLTAARFLWRPGMGRAYRTGDLGFWRPDGRLQLSGRSDRQVKVNGHRIELGEIEALLEEHPRVEAAAVITWAANGAARLNAFVVGKNGELSPDELWSYLAQRLPSYLIPSGISLMPDLPAGPTGKVDYRRLAVLAADAEPAAVATPDDNSNADECTSWLLALWCELCVNPRLNVDSNLFLSGCDSLGATSVAERIRHRYRIEMPLVAIFSNPTPRGLARVIRAGIIEAERVQRPDLPDKA
jgi:amino acid adenylation domain-containing protein